MRIPCAVGDTVWAIRNFKGVKHPQQGIVSQMFVNDIGKLVVVVKYIARGEWGKTVFPDEASALASLGREMKILDSHRGELTEQQYKVIRGQILSGDTDGAIQGMNKILRRNRRTNENRHF